MAPRRDTIVIGSSAGGVHALRRLLGALPSDLDATVLVAQHQGDGGGQLDRALIGASALPVRFAEDGEIPRPARVYLAPPDRHLLVDGERLRVVAGPRENRARPAVDPLYRSAAATRGSRTVAVQLTGRLADGVAGLEAVRRCGGLVVVQDPEDAEHPEMPSNALAAGEADHVVALDALAPLLVRLAGEVAPAVEIPGDVAFEARLSFDGPSRPQGVDRTGDQVAVACPDCGGPLWQSGEGEAATFRCHVGHALSTRVLLDAQRDQIERSLWVAVRTLSEQAATLARLADSAESRGNRLCQGYRERAEEALQHSDRARRFLLSLHDTPSHSLTDKADKADDRDAGDDGDADIEGELEATVV